MNAAIRNASGERLDYSFEVGRGALVRKDWIIVLGHGVTGNKDRPVIVDTAHALNAAGFDTLRFSFSGNGASEGDFRAASVTKGAGDLRAVLAAVAPHYAKAGYVGHSMGAASGVLQIARGANVHGLVSLAGMVNTKAFAEKEFGDVTPDEGCMWDDEACPLSSAFMRDLCETIGTLAPQAEKIEVPWLLAHGLADDVVNPSDTKLIESLRGDAVEVVRIEGADHSFAEPAHQRQLAEAVVSWWSQLA